MPLPFLLSSCSFTASMIRRLLSAPDGGVIEPFHFEIEFNLDIACELDLPLEELPLQPPLSMPLLFEDPSDSHENLLFPPNLIPNSSSISVLPCSCPRPSEGSGIAISITS